MQRARWDPNEWAIGAPVWSGEANPNINQHVGPESVAQHVQIESMVSQIKATQLLPNSEAHDVPVLSNKERREQRRGRFRPISDQPGSSNDTCFLNVHPEISPNAGPKRDLVWHSEPPLPDTKRARADIVCASSKVELPQVIYDAGHEQVAKRKLALTKPDRTRDHKHPRINLPPGSKLAERFPQFVRGIADATTSHEDPTRTHVD